MNITNGSVLANAASSNALQVRPEIVGEVQIATRLDVDEGVVLEWVERGLLPPPEGEVAGFRAWRWGTVRDWARRTGRLGLEAAVLAMLPQGTGLWDLPTLQAALAQGGVFTELEPAQLNRALEDLLEGELVARLTGECWSLSPQPMY